MNIIMAQMTNWYNIKPMLLFITKMVILLCLFAAYKTLKKTCWLYFPLVYLPIDSSYSFSFLWVFKAIYFMVLISDLLAVFGLSVSFSVSTIRPVTAHFTPAGKPFFPRLVFVVFRRQLSLSALWTSFFRNKRPTCLRTSDTTRKDLVQVGRANSNIGTFF